MGMLTRENPSLLLHANFQASIVSGARRRAASAWLAEETHFPKIIPSVTVLKAVGFIVQFWKKENIYIRLATKLLMI